MVIAMGDKSPKSKERGRQQKDAAKATSAAQAKAKQESYSRPAAPVLKGRK
jgi:hypothetical protein